MNRQQMRRNERKNEIAEAIMSALDAGPQTRRELFGAVHESSARVGITEYARELLAMRRCGIVRFSGPVQGDQLIELTPEWR